MKTKFVVGLTGGIASGKSTVAQVFKILGAEVVDSDRVARTFLSDKEIVAQLVEAFGSKILNSNGEISRKDLKEVAFSSLQNVQELNKIMWSPTKNEIANVISGLTGIVVLESALLFESGLDAFTDFDITVSVTSQIRLSRLLDRDKTLLHVDTILKSQLTDEQRERKANLILNNNLDLAQLEKNATIAFCALQDSFKSF